MKTHFMHLDKILNIQKWQSLQDSLALSTKLAIITVDYKGVPVTRHSEPRPFCKMVRQIPELEEYCRKCDSRGGLEAVRLNKPYIYLCHCNIVDIAVPIIIDGKYIGAIMAGQVKLLPADSKHTLEQILAAPQRNLLQDPIFQNMYDEIPTIPNQEIEILSQMLYELSQYIVGEAVNHNLMLEIKEHVNHHNNNGNDLLLEGYNLDTIDSVRRDLEAAVINAHMKSSSQKVFHCINHTLEPAFHYIYQNKGESITLKKAAELCHISESHFSRLFKKETGENFSGFYSRQKVEWSKHLLEQTDLSIAQISDQLGFGEQGYFIKTFKKYETITPSVYRKYFRESTVLKA